jgi:hypothetical protein
MAFKHIQKRRALGIPCDVDLDVAGPRAYCAARSDGPERVTLGSNQQLGVGVGKRFKRDNPTSISSLADPTCELPYICTHIKDCGDFAPVYRELKAKRGIVMCTVLSYIAAESSNEPSNYMLHLRGHNLSARLDVFINFYSNLVNV